MAEFSSREFNQNVSAAKRAALDGPVIVTDRGAPSHVLLSYPEYRRLSGAIDEKPLAELLYHADADDIELPLPERPDTPSLRIPEFD